MRGSLTAGLTFCQLTSERVLRALQVAWGPMALHFTAPNTGGYPTVKRRQVLSALSPEEQDEVERLEARQKRSAATERRREQLWTKAFRDHRAPDRPPV